MKSLYITCQPFLEDLLLQELQEMGFAQLQREKQGVSLKTTDPLAIYRINYLSRIASRVLLPLKKFVLEDKESLYEAIGEIDWLHYLKPDSTFLVDVTGAHAAFHNTLYAAQVVKDAICDQIRQKKGIRPSIDKVDPFLRLSLHLAKETGSLSIDTSGAPLYRRGYRQALGKAPLNEALAAALLKKAGFTGSEKMIDPLCGSGTFLIEAASIATQTPAQFLRSSFAFMNLPFFSQKEWSALQAELNLAKKPLIKGQIQGIDCDPSQIALADTHLKKCGFWPDVVLRCARFETVSGLEVNFAICNPPYGVRLSQGEALKPLYAALGDFFKRELKGGSAHLFTGNIPLAKAVGLRADERLPFSNGGIDSRLLSYRIY